MGIIQLLPDNIANQIAAGEVIQRPASAVKELMENAVDAGATQIKLFVEDGGKSLVQVLDNGSGMSISDARMAFERHATSKIKNIQDLFRIKTMGFRGEALASIAAVSEVEMKTKRSEDDAGTLVNVENSLIQRCEPCAAVNGTNIAMKNLFFNVPARRNFLKSNPAEMRHIVDEFVRIALSFPDIFFSLTSNHQEIFHLEKSSLKQRIVQILGDNYQSRLVSVHEDTDYLNISGFVGKPEAAKKTRGDQYFFVNNRFIRSGYLHHAVMGAYQQMVAADSFPLYILFITIDPAQVDINVHPTKQEIKFEDEKVAYAFVLAAVRHALAQFSITPTLDFDLDPGIQGLDAVEKPFTSKQEAQATASSLFRTFTQKNQAHFIERDNPGALKHWREFFEPNGAPIASRANEPEAGSGPTLSYESAGHSLPLEFNTTAPLPIIQLHGTYILVTTPDGLMLVNQQLAHERVLYERYLASGEGHSAPSQKNLFPVTINLSYPDALLLSELLTDLNQLGYAIEPFGKDAFILQGTPANTSPGNEKSALEDLLEQYKHFSAQMKFSRREKLIRTLAWQHSVKAGTPLSFVEMENLLQDLFRCDQPNIAPNGNPTLVEFKKEYLDKLFGK